MKTLVVDAKNRIRLPHAQPRQVFAYEPEADGVIRLLPVKVETEEPFPRGSLVKFLTPEHNAEIALLAKSSSLAVAG
jgi:hypothetical protein